jgi:hypothetical protein
VTARKQSAPDSPPRWEYSPARRRCSKCGETRPANEFYQSRDSWCKACLRESSRRWRERNPEYGARKSREYCQNGRRKVLDKARRTRGKTPPPYHYVPIRQAAIDLELSESHTRVLARIGMMRRVSYGKRIYVDPADVRKLVERRNRGDRRMKLEE